MTYVFWGAVWLVSGMLVALAFGRIVTDMWRAADEDVINGCGPKADDFAHWEVELSEVE